MRERIKWANANLSARKWIHSLSQKTDSAFIKLAFIRSKNIFSSKFNKRNLECGHPLAETYIGAYAS